MTLLEARLAELMMRDLSPCDLGDGIEVVHDVEAVEVEMECDLEDADDNPMRWFDEEFAGTLKFAREPGTRQFVRESSPYERIELQIDPSAFLRATNEEAMQLGSAWPAVPAGDSPRR